MSSKIHILEKLIFALSRVFIKWRFFKYFKPIKRSTLPLPNGLLSEFVPSSSIEAANKEVESFVSQAEKSLSENDAEGNGAAASESKVMKRGHT